MPEQESVSFGPVYGRRRSSASEIVKLPLWYLRALFQPTAQTFAMAAERARWGVVWFQILLLILIPGILGLVRDIDRSLAPRTSTHSGFLYDILVSFSFGASTAGLILRTLIVPIFFFITVVVQFLLAKAFGGRGRFLGQAHATLLYQVPLAIIGSLIQMVVVFIHSVDLRVFTPVVSLALFIYGILLNISMLSGVHRLAHSKATWVVVLYYVVLILVVIGLLFLLAHAIISAVRGIR